MAVTATPDVNGRHGASDALVEPRKPDRRTALADLTDEVAALTAEREVIRLEVAYLRDLLTYAFRLDRWDIVSTVRDRLANLAGTLGRRGAA